MASPHPQGGIGNHHRMNMQQLSERRDAINPVKFTMNKFFETTFSIMSICLRDPLASFLKSAVAS